MGLDDPLKKMSKSEKQSHHAINLLDPPDVIRSKIMKAKTDPSRGVRFDESRPGIYNLLVIYELFTGLERPDIEVRFEGKGYAFLKKELSEAVIGVLSPIQQRYIELTADPGHIGSLLREGASRVRPIAEKTLRNVKEKVGIGLVQAPLSSKACSCLLPPEPVS